MHILRQSQRLLADLIAIPLPMDLVRWCWLPEELLDELVRRADCPVLCVPASQGSTTGDSAFLRTGRTLFRRDLRTEQGVLTQAGV